MGGNEFSLQLDEATTSTSNKDAYLICYVRFIDNDDNMFAILNNFFQENNLQKYCIGLCMDGALAMSGRFGRLRTLVQGIAVNTKWTHCLIQCEVLALPNTIQCA